MVETNVEDDTNSQSENSADSMEMMQWDTCFFAIYMFDCYRIYKKHYNYDTEMNYYIFVTTDNRLAIKHNSVSKTAKFVDVYRIDEVTIKCDDVEYIKIYCNIGVYNKFISNPFI